MQAWFVQEAINGAPQTTTAASPWVILVNPAPTGNWFTSSTKKRFVHLVGEDPAKTVITYDFEPPTSPAGMAFQLERSGLPLG